jgi:hypothetical protein
MQLCPGCGSTVAGDATECPICTMSLGPAYGPDGRIVSESSEDRLDDSASLVAPDIPLPTAPTPLEQLTALPIARRERTGVFGDPVAVATKAPSVPSHRLATGTRPSVDPLSDPRLSGPQQIPARRPSVGSAPLAGGPAAGQAARAPMNPPPGMEQALPLQARAPQAVLAQQTQPVLGSPPEPARRPTVAALPKEKPRTPVSRTPKVAITTTRRSEQTSSALPIVLIAVVVVAIGIIITMVVAGRNQGQSGQARVRESTAAKVKVSTHRPGR